MVEKNRFYTNPGSSPGTLFSFLQNPALQAEPDMNPINRNVRFLRLIIFSFSSNVCVFVLTCVGLITQLLLTEKQKTFLNISSSVHHHHQDHFITSRTCDKDTSLVSHYGGVHVTQRLFKTPGVFKDSDDWLSPPGDMYTAEEGEEEPEWVETERQQFSEFRDKNNDGKMDKEETLDWILPPDYDHAEAEAKHLLHESDANKVGLTPGYPLQFNSWLLLG